MPSKHPIPQARDFMTRKVRSVSPEMSLSEVVAFLEKHGISNAPVVESLDGRDLLVGFLSERDCLEFLANESFYGSPAPPQTAMTIMRKHPVCVEPETELFTLASIFVNHGYRHLPVVEDGELVGIVSRRDILKAMNAFYSDEIRAKDKQRQRPDYEDIMQRRFVLSDRSVHPGH